MSDGDLFAFVQIAAILVAGLASLAFVAFRFCILVTEHAAANVKVVDPRAALAAGNANLLQKSAKVVGPSVEECDTVAALELTLDLQDQLGGLGEGSSDSVNHGNTNRGSDCTVKAVLASTVDAQMMLSFANELCLLSPLRHSNLVVLISGCWGTNSLMDKLCIVLEYTRTRWTGARTGW